MNTLLEDISYKTRGIRPALDEALSDTPVVCILGPRQCGKSTLARQCDPERRYITLDDRTYLDLALADSQGFIDQLPEKVTIDEVQRVPELTLAVKRSVDNNRKPGRFLLTGSANLLQLPRLSDSLAGRMECLYLHPFTTSEIEGVSGNFLADWLAGKIRASIGATPAPAPSALPVRLCAGGYPEAFTRAPRRARNWQKQYLNSIIERDIQDIATVRDGADISRLLTYFSLNTAQLVNFTAMSKTLAHTRATIERYVGILGKIFLIRLLPAWHSNRSKRLIKTPKMHVCDSGLAATLSGLREERWNEDRSRFGHLLESFVLHELTAMAGWLEDPPEFSHYRDKDQVEVDIVIETRGEIRGVEIKASATVNSSDGKGLLRLAEIAGKKFQGGIVFYDGHATVPLHRKRNIFAVPIARLWEG